jgi:hypothetical protein
LCEADELRSKLEVYRSEACEREGQRQYGMYEAAEAHGCHRSCHRQYCEDREQQDSPFVFFISGYSANR